MVYSSLTLNALLAFGFDKPTLAIPSACFPSKASPPALTAQSFRAITGRFRGGLAYAGIRNLAASGTVALLPS